VREIYERDGWKCQICNRRCKKAFLVSKRDGRPHPRSPTLDHIRSMANGGNHEPSNVQLACFECNTKKGAESRGQLRLALA
jgi:5-methylcytosine-specific restriction endonuclease McrA